MVSYAENKENYSKNEIWCVEHYPVFTQGKHGKKGNILVNSQGISTMQTDRGGQITYHGPGQAVIYFILNLKSLSIGVKYLIYLIENSMLLLLHYYKIAGHLINKIPGVYVENKKIASLGLRVKNFRTYHGIAINTKMDLTPFSYINPCGYKGMQMTQIYDFYSRIELPHVFRNYTNIFTMLLKSGVKNTTFRVIK
jgi:lipoyl(octanoyl) transferase